MKKLLSFALCAFVLLTALCGCKGDTVYGLSTGSYVLQDTDVPLKPTVSFNTKDKTFTFSYDALSSYLSHGNFEISNGKIIAQTSDGKYTYIFKVIDNEKICFVEKGSSKIIMTPQDTPPSVTEGAEFIFKN